MARGRRGGPAGGSSRGDERGEAGVPAGPEAAPGSPSGRPFLVFDGDGEPVATFSTWESAHVWSHMRASEPLTLLPVRIEDHLERCTWTIDADQCRMTAWRRDLEHRVCLAGPLVPPAEAHMR